MTSTPFRCSASAACCCVALFGGEFARVAAAAGGADAEIEEFRAERSICSFVSGRTSKPSTCAPRRRAVAIACRPATPAPTISTLRRPDRAGRGRQHREEFRTRFGRDQHGLVAGDVRLRGQHVHRLRARRARQQLHRERGDLAIAQRFRALGRQMRLQIADDDRAFLQRADFVERRRLHFQQHVAARKHVARVGRLDILV